ncbi:MAG: type I secretion system permease/ATPase [Betaproteobacteria bacterium]|nr:type I secretion system permease/ATPase [Betaproteobacteria bacterium]
MSDSPDPGSAKDSKANLFSSLGLREDLLLDDPLLECLLEVARIHGRASTRAALTAGLPLVGGRLTPALISRAANRAGLNCRLVRKDLDRIERAQFPVILLLLNNEACVLTDWSADGNEAQILLPDSGQSTFAMSRADLAQRYAGVAVILHPRFRYDRRIPELARLDAHHWFWGVILDQWRVYRDVLVAALLINVFALSLPLFSMNVYDRVVPAHAVDTLWVLALSVLLLLALDFLLRMMRGHFIDHASARIDLQLSSTLMERVLGLKMAARPASVGAFAATMKSYEVIRDFIASATVATMVDIPFALFFYVTIAWIAWPLVFVPIVGFLMVGIYVYAIQHKLHELSMATYKAGALRNATLVESLSAMETVKALGAENQIQTNWEKTSAFLTKISNQQRTLSLSATQSVQTIQQVVNIAALVGGVYLIHNGTLTQGGMIACTMLMGRAMTPLGQMAGLLIQYQGAKTSLEPLNKLMADPIERPPESTFVHRADLSGKIEFRDVTFGYPNTDPALRNVSFCINPGESVVILGKVGSGKSTIQKLIMGLYEPQMGSVLVDDIDLRQIDPADLRRNIGYVGQESILFYGTLRENIVYGAPYAEDSAILAAAGLAGLLTLINKHPRGFDMQIGERGDTLSGGQRQGVAIARAFLTDPPLLVLDEPTSGMDYTTESEFKVRLGRFSKRSTPGKTVVISTHRSSLVDLADRIIVIDNGIIVADGPRNEVVEALQTGKVERAG